MEKKVAGQGHLCVRFSLLAIGERRFDTFGAAVAVDLDTQVFFFLVVTLQQPQVTAKICRLLRKLQSLRFS